MNTDKWLAAVHSTFPALTKERADIDTFDLLNVELSTLSPTDVGEYVVTYPVYMHDSEEGHVTGTLRVCFDENSQIIDNYCHNWDKSKTRFYVVTPTNYFFAVNIDLDRDQLKGCEFIVDETKAYTRYAEMNGVDYIDVYDCAYAIISPTHYMCDRGISSAFEGNAEQFLLDFVM